MQIEGLSRTDAAPRTPGRLLTWALWASATLVTLAFARPGYFVAHDVEHRLGAVVQYTSSFSKVSIFVTARLGLVAAGLSAVSATLVWRVPRADRAIIGFQVLAFIGLCALLAGGLLAPFECMCDYEGGLVD